MSLGVIDLDMKATGGADAHKRAAGESAANTVTDGDVVGLGTGSTAAHAIRALGDAIDSGQQIRGVPTSYETRKVAREVGIPLLTLNETVGPDAPGIDVAIDGADQIADGTLIKGGGAAHTREKVVDTAAARFLVVADTSKETDTLDHPVPIEVLPEARQTVSARLRQLGGDPKVRPAVQKDGPVITEHGNLVVDCAFGQIDTPESLSRDLTAVPGVFEHGLFVDMVDEVHVGTTDGVRVDRRS